MLRAAAIRSFVTPLFRCLQQHEVLRDRRDVIDALVVGVALVVRGEDATCLSHAKDLEGFESEVTIQKKKALALFRENSQRLYQANFANR